VTLSDLGGVDLTEPIEQIVAFPCGMQVDSPVNGTVAVDVGVLNEELGGALEVFEEPLIEVGIARPDVPAVVELDCPEQR